MTQKSQNKLITNPREVIKVADNIDQVVCDGGGGPLGHPQVWYNFEGRDHASCHYCGRKFVKSVTE
jgi:uncharacterized Zn-finger protein